MRSHKARLLKRTQLQPHSSLKMLQLHIQYMHKFSSAIYTHLLILNKKRLTYYILLSQDLKYAVFQKNLPVKCIAASINKMPIETAFDGS